MSLVVYMCVHVCAYMYAIPARTCKHRITETVSEQNQDWDSTPGRHIG